jgi:hypothetical protein
VTRTLVALALSISALACSSKKPPPKRDDAATASIDAGQPELVVIRRVDVAIVAPPGEDHPTRDRIAAAFANLGDGTRAEGAPLPAGTIARPGTLRADLTWDVGGTDPAPLVLMTIEATIDLDGGVLTRKLALRAGPPGDLARVATTAEVELAAWAIELAAERRDPNVRAAAVAGLGASPRLRAASIQYLVALGDPENVKHIAHAADFASPDELATIIEAVTALGGEEARAFLEMMAAGASDPDLAERAQQGLDRIDRRERPSSR